MPTESFTMGTPFHEGLVIDNYVIQGKLGAGGMGVVYRAKDVKLQRQVAIKFIKAGEAGHIMERFERELKISASLDHPYIVKVYQSGIFNKFPYCVMEYVQGLPLLEYVKLHQVDVAGRLIIVKKIAQALAYAHKQNIVHRDVKPSNILVRDNGDPVLMDFGIAKITQSGDRSMTRSGEILGTLEYMAPEQAEGKKREIDAATDTYGLGAVLYHLLTGQPPVNGSDMMGKIYQVVYEKPVPPSRLCPKLPPRVEKICLKALEKKKARRYVSGEQLAADIEAHLEGREQTLAQRDFERQQWLTRLRILASTVAVAALLLASFAISKNWRKPGTAVTEAKNASVSRIVKLYEDGKKKYGEGNYQEAYMYLDHVRHVLEKEKKKNPPESWSQQDKNKIKELSAELPAAIIAAAFDARQYAQVYDWHVHADSLSSSRLFESRCYIACAAYHCGHSEVAEKSLQELVQEIADKSSRALSPGEAEIWKAEKDLLLPLITCYQGMIAFSHKRWSEAISYLKNAIDMQGKRQTRFASILYLHYCAAMLLDIDQPLDPATQKSVEEYLAEVDKGMADFHADPTLHMLHQEIQARYYLRRAERDKDQDAAKKAISHIQACLQSQEKKAVWYYIRGRAHVVLGDVNNAKADLDTACLLEPAQLGPFLAIAELLWQDPRPPELRRISIELPTRIFKSMHVAVDLFSSQFAELAEEKTYRGQGIPFRQEMFDHYVKQLWDDKEEVKQVAQNALASFVPASETRKALARIEQKDPQYSAVIPHLASEIDLREQQGWRQEFLHQLSRVPWRSHIWNMEHFYPQETKAREKNLDYLKSILADRQQSIFLRFLAGRVLAELPDIKIRDYLWQNYLLNQRDQQPSDMAATIMVSHALWQLGYVHSIMDLNFSFQAGRWLEQVSDANAGNQFLQCLLAELLWPADPQGLSLVEKMLAFPGERCRLMAASRCLWPNSLEPEVLKRLIKVLTEGLYHKEEEMQTAALSVLCQFLTTTDINAQLQWQPMIDNFFLRNSFSHLSQQLKQESPQLQNAIMQFWRESARMLMGLEEQGLVQQMREQIRPLWESKDPQVRYQALTTSSSLLDQKVFEKISPNSDINLLENIASLLGAITSASIEPYKSNARMQIFNLIKKKKLLETKNVPMRVMILYLLGSEAGSAVFSPLVLAALHDPEPYIRCVGAVTTARWPRLQPKFMEELRRLAGNDEHIMVRTAALGVLLNHLHKEKSPELERWHLLAKEKEGPEGTEYALVAGWGYGIPWEMYVLASPSLRSKFKWPVQQNWHHMASEFLQYSGEVDKRQEHTSRLQRGIDILQKQKDLPIYHEYIYLLSLIYEQDGKYGQIIELVDDIVRGTVRENHFCWLWTKAMIHEKRSEEAEHVLRQKLAAIANQMPKDLGEMHALAMHHAQLLRSLAEIHVAQKQEDFGEQLLHQQYLLYPQDPSTSIAIAEHYYARQDYVRARYAFQNLQEILPKNSEFSLSLAKIAAKTNNMRQLLFYLEWAKIQNKQMKITDLEKYAELSHCTSHPEVQKIFK